ncbi:hypothetical protein [Ornithinimicrobium kibberense]|uniref:hypothetical protein n=1 Tax=Ornithinimicrobium kibberense TaxID=282060 RepID=UPI00362052F2
MEVAEQLAEAETQLRLLVGARGALNLTDVEHVIGHPSDVERLVAAAGGQGHEAGLADAFGELDLEVLVGLGTAVDRVRVPQDERGLRARLLVLESSGRLHVGPSALGESL